MLEKRLNRLFDYQRFARNAALAGMLAEAQTRHPAPLAEELLDKVAGGRPLIWVEPVPLKPREERRKPVEEQ